MSKINNNNNGNNEAKKYYFIKNQNGKELVVGFNENAEVNERYTELTEAQLNVYLNYPNATIAQIKSGIPPEPEEELDFDTYCTQLATELKQIANSYIANAITPLVMHTQVLLATGQEGINTQSLVNYIIFSNQIRGKYNEFLGAKNNNPNGYFNNSEATIHFEDRKIDFDFLYNTYKNNNEGSVI